MKLYLCAQNAEISPNKEQSTVYTSAAKNPRFLRRDSQMGRWRTDWRSGQSQRPIQCVQQSLQRAFRTRFTPTAYAARALA